MTVREFLEKQPKDLRVKAKFWWEDEIVPHFDEKTASAEEFLNCLQSEKEEKKGFEYKLGFRVEKTTYDWESRSVEIEACESLRTRITLKNLLVLLPIDQHIEINTSKGRVYGTPESFLDEEETVGFDCLNETIVEMYTEENDFLYIKIGV